MAVSREKESRSSSSSVAITRSNDGAGQQRPRHSSNKSKKPAAGPSANDVSLIPGTVPTPNEEVVTAAMLATQSDSISIAIDEMAAQRAAIDEAIEEIFVDEEANGHDEPLPPGQPTATAAAAATVVEIRPPLTKKERKALKKKRRRASLEARARSEGATGTAATTPREAWAADGVDVNGKSETRISMRRRRTNAQNSDANSGGRSPVLVSALLYQPVVTNKESFARDAFVSESTTVSWLNAALGLLLSSALLAHARERLLALIFASCALVIVIVTAIVYYHHLGELLKARTIIPGRMLVALVCVVFFIVGVVAAALYFAYPQ
eukprot:Opistho-2@84029